jgi:hypothetical protein
LRAKPPIEHSAGSTPTTSQTRAKDATVVVPVSVLTASSAMLQTAPTLSLWDGIRAVRLKLWGEDSKQLVTFPQVRRLPAPGS